MLQFQGMTHYIDCPQEISVKIKANKLITEAAFNSNTKGTAEIFPNKDKKEQ